MLKDRLAFMELIAGLLRIGYEGAFLGKKLQGLKQTCPNFRADPNGISGTSLNTDQVRAKLKKVIDNLLYHVINKFHNPAIRIESDMVEIYDRTNGHHLTKGFTKQVLISHSNCTRRVL